MKPAEARLRSVDVRHGSVLVVAAAVLFPAGAHAQPPSADKAAAEALFSDARRLMAAGNYREACPKLEASQRLDPGVGTVLNLADCYEQSGRTASAWTEFREAASAARESGSADREAEARRRASALEPRLSYLVISRQDPAIQVVQDGKPLDAAVLGTPIPVDPGDHVVEATAPGKAKWSTTVQVRQEGLRLAVDIPELAPVAPGAPLARGAKTPPAAPAPKSGGSTQRTIAIVVGGAGVVAMGLGTFFGVKASSTWDDAKSHCTDYPHGCGDEGVSLGKDANGQANVATAMFIVGGVALASAATLWFTAPSKGGGEVAVGAGPSGLNVRGRF